MRQHSVGNVRHTQFAVHIAAHTMMESRETAALLTLAKYHTVQAGIVALLTLCFGLVPPIASAVSYFWWLGLLGLPLFVVPIVLTVFASARIVGHEKRLLVVHVVGQVLLASILSAWLGRFALVLASFTFIGLLVQMIYYEVTDKQVSLRGAISLPVGTEMLIWLGGEIALVPALSLSGVLILTGGLLCSLVYLVVFTLGSFHRACTSGKSDALGLWTSYAALCTWVNLN